MSTLADDGLDARELPHPTGQSVCKTNVVTLVYSQLTFSLPVLLHRGSSYFNMRARYGVWYRS